MPGAYFRLMRIGCFEGIDSERAWLLRKLMEAGTPRALLDLVAGLFLVSVTADLDLQSRFPANSLGPHRVWHRSSNCVA